MEKGEWSVANEEWWVEIGVLIVENGKWSMESVKW